MIKYKVMIQTKSIFDLFRRKWMNFSYSVIITGIKIELACSIFYFATYV